MNAHATRVMNAVSAGQEVMAQNSSVWDTRPAIVNKKAVLDATFDEVMLLEGSIMDVGGSSVMKTLARNNAALAAIKLAKPMTVFARDTNDAELEEEINFSWSSLRHCKDQDGIDRWQLVHDRADSHVAALVAGGYGDAVWVTELADAIAAFKVERGKPKAKRADIKALNAQVAIKIKELQVIKTNLLDLLVQFMVSNPSFYGTAENAFELNMTGRRHLALRLHFFDEATGIRLPKVQAEVVELGLSKTASKSGRIDISQQQLPQGNYMLVFKLKGFVEQQLSDVAIEKGKLNTIDVTLVKIG